MMDPITAFMSISLIGLIITIGTIIYIVPIINQLKTNMTGSINRPQSCPDNSSVEKNNYRVPGFDNCYCSQGYTVVNNACKACPVGSSTIERSVAVPDQIGCYCYQGYGWSDGKCIKYPDRSTTVNTGIPIPSLEGVYCLSNTLWNESTKTCDPCPIGSGTDIGTVKVPGYTGCYCSPGKTWDPTLDMCNTGICDGHGSMQNNICTCDNGYYLYNNTMCTKCIDGTIEGTICTCPQFTTFSSYKDGCISQSIENANI